MAVDTLSRSATDYYLKIQALTPVESSDQPTDTYPLTEASVQIPALSVVIFLGVLLIGAFALLITKTHQLNKMLVLITLAFVLSGVPLALHTVSQPATYRSQASPLLPPTNFEVKRPNSTTLDFTWTTEKPNIGAVRIATDPDMRSARVTSELSEQPLTQHGVSITGLDPLKTYYVTVLSGTTWFGSTHRPITIPIALP